MDSEKKEKIETSPKKKYDLRKKKPVKYKQVSSDSDDSDWVPEFDASVNQLNDSSSESEVDEDNIEEGDDDMNVLELQKFMQKIFPSKSGQDRLNQLEKIDKLHNKQKNVKSKTPKKNNKSPKISDTTKRSKHSDKTKRSNKKIKKMKKNLSDSESDDDEDVENMKKQRKQQHKKMKNKKKTNPELLDDEEKFLDAMNTYEKQLIAEGLLEDRENMEGDALDKLGMQNMKYNIVFTVNGNEDYLEDSLSDTDDEKEEKSSKNEKFQKKEKIKVKLKEWDTFYKGIILKVRENGNYDIKLDDNTYEHLKDIKGKYIKSVSKEEEYNDMIKELGELVDIKNNKGSNAMVKRFEELSKANEEKKLKNQEEKDKKEKSKNVIRLRKLLREKNDTNDFKYFGTMDITQQKNILSKLKEVNEYYTIEKPYRITLLESDIPVQFKSQALKKINTLAHMDPGSGEYYKIKQWVDAFMRIPFEKKYNLPISISDGTDICSNFLEEAKQILDDCVYGLDDAKMQILQYIGQWIANPSTTGTAIAIKGPPGTGKTTLIKEGISKILKRPFAFLALGGATDSSFLEGHSYTYEGSSWGKIVDIMIQSKCMNPVIFMDELDKISDTPKGEEIAGILTHLTDTTQNDKFHDKYFANVDFDLSQALFIFSYNDENKINPILKDRMYRIHTDGYDKTQKTVIAQKYMIPKIEKNINFEKGNIIIEDEILHFIIETYTEKERGVRNLKRCLEIIYTKLNLYRLMKPGSELFEKEQSLEVTFPLAVTEEIVKKLIKTGETKNNTPFGMYI
jgi:ATP-dependent Lon protease